MLTRGILEGKCYGATWPSRGLPHGTPPLVGLFGKILWTPQGVEPMTSGLGEELWQGWATSLPTLFLITISV
jgi:hypothetical protein